MRNFNEHTITDAVLARLANTQHPRTKAISQSLVRHLHNFVREIEPTQREWEIAIDFLTCTGQMCNAVRQEYILFSDTLGVTMLVDAINHRHPRGTTETTVLGPFYVDNAPEVSLGTRISQIEEGPELLIQGCVRRLDGSPIADATVDIWHSDDAGFYDVQKDAQHLTSRARVRTDNNGNFWVIGAIPAPYPIPNDGPVGKMLALQGRHPYRPAHVHFMIAATGFDTLVTHLFLDGSEYLDSDVVFGVKDSLIEKVLETPAGITPYGAKLERAMATLSREFVLAEQTPPQP